VERELNISYPTVRSRLDDVIRALGYDATGDGGTEPTLAGVAGATGSTGTAGGNGASTATAPSATAPDPARRRQVLDRLAAGEITAEQAVAELRSAGQ
jgi:hypothetical protein